ncbi:MAG: hypothetical protein LC793_07795 [Thermomicrobia bacterium]|nr:hypothetical protein [Thermomicrobia bacterium]
MTEFGIRQLLIVQIEGDAIAGPLVDSTLAGPVAATPSEAPGQRCD